MSLPLAYRPEVRDDIDNAYQWYEKQRLGLGEKFLKELRKALERIQGTPELYGVIYRGVRACPMRRFLYVVYYRVEVMRVLILAVHHGRRHPKSWRSRI